MRSILPYCLFCLCFIHYEVQAQKTWSLEISSNVELRTLKLTNKAEQNTKPLKGATITLYQGSSVVKQTQSNGSGDFSVLVPPDGDFMIVVTYPGCNAKKFQVSTQGVPENFDQEGWEPAFPIGGVIMARPLYGIDYSALREPVVRVVFKQKGKVFDDDADFTDEALGRLRKIKADEDDLIARFLEAVNAGDAALRKPDCPLAKAMYEKALALIPREEYPMAQLAKVGDCIAEKENKDKILEAEAEKKREEEAVKQKAKDEKKAREIAQAKQLVKDKEEARIKQKEENERNARAEAANATSKETGEKALNDASDKQSVKKTEGEKKKPAPEAEKITMTYPGEAVPTKKVKREEAAQASKTPVGSKSLTPVKPVIQQGTGVSKEEEGKAKSKKTRYQTPQVIGLSQYQKLINEADGKFSEKDYTRAKVLYTKALDLKPADAYATERLKEIKVLLSKGTND